MEKRFLTHFLFVYATFFLLFNSATCRTSPSSTNSKHATTVFDVSPSVQPADHRQTLQLQQQQQQSNISLSQPFLSLSLHPRSALHKPLHNHYSALTLNRLRRDSARVKSIAAKLEKALNANADTSTTSFQTNKDIEAPLTSGKSQGSGEYFARLGVGQPPSQYYMSIDTGSDVSWLQCQPCSDCYPQSDSIFNPSSSSTYRSLTCDSPLCSAFQGSSCRGGSCLYRVSYGDGSFTSGDLASETLSFGDSGFVNNVAIGCGHDNEGLFAGSAGLLGLGGGSLSLPSQIKATSFSYCLVDHDSSESSTLEFNSGSPGNAVTTPLIHNPRIDTYLYAGLSGISVGGQPLNISPSVFELENNGQGGAIVDSGTAITRLKPEVYDSLREAFAEMTSDLPSADSYEILDTCYDLSSMKTVSVPTVSFQFTGNKTLSLDPKNYLVRINDAGTVCLAFAAADLPVQIIGNVQQQGIRVSFDLANSIVGFTPNQC